MTEIPELSGSYEVIAKIGQGSQGVVYKAIQKSLGREVVLKVSRSVEEQSRLEYRREAEILSGIRHPNIVLLLDFGLLDSLTYTAYPYIPGRTLFDLLVERKTIAWREAAKLAHEIASALERVHRQGVIHRDVKPSNIWIAEDGQAQLMDFGTGRKAGTGLTTAPGIFRGTIPYAAPEQLLGQGIDGRADLSALGRVLFESLHGVNPYNAGTLEGCMDRILNLAPGDLPPLPGQTPRAFAVLILQLLEKDPADRPANARDVHLEISRLLSTPREDLVRLSASELFFSNRSVRPPVSPGKARDTRVHEVEGSARPLPWRRRFPWLLLPLVAAALWSWRSPDTPLAPRPVVTMVTPAPSQVPSPAAGGSSILDWERHGALIDRLRAGGDTAHRAAQWLSDNTPYDLGPNPEFWLYWLEIARWLRTTEDPAPPPPPVVAIDNFQHMAETIITYERIQTGLRYNRNLRYRAYKAFLWRAYQFSSLGRGWIGMARILELEEEPAVARRLYRIAFQRLREKELVDEGPLVWEGMVRGLDLVPGHELERDWIRMVKLFGGDEKAVDPWQALFDMLVESDRQKLERILRAAVAGGPPDTPARAFLEAVGTTRPDQAPAGR